MIQNFGERNPATPSQHPTPEQYADARRYVLHNAPDLMAVIFGSDQ